MSHDRKRNSTLQKERSFGETSSLHELGSFVVWQPCSSPSAVLLHRFSGESVLCDDAYGHFDRLQPAVLFKVLSGCDARVPVQPREEGDFQAVQLFQRHAPGTCVVCVEQSFVGKEFLDDHRCGEVQPVHVAKSNPEVRTLLLDSTGVDGHCDRREHWTAHRAVRVLAEVVHVPCDAQLRHHGRIKRRNVFDDRLFVRGCDRCDNSSNMLDFGNCFWLNHFLYRFVCFSKGEGRKGVGDWALKNKSDFSSSLALALLLLMR